MKHVTRRLFRYAWVVCVPLFVSTLAVVAWKFLLYDRGLYFNPEAETPILYLIVPPVGFIYVIFASLAVNAVFEKHRRLSRSIVRKDIKAYIEHREQHLPVLMYILIAMPSAILLFLAMTYYYVDFYGGVASVFLVTSVITLTWTVVYELDTSHKRHYSKVSGPDHWRKARSEDYFSDEL